MPRYPLVTRAHSARAAFTLIELLAVIAIVGVLAGLILAVLGSAKIKANQSKCAANLRSIGTAFNQFAADHRGYYPAVTYNLAHLEGRVNPNKSHWWVELKPYIGVDIKTIGGIPGNAFAICPDGLTGMNGKFDYYFQTTRASIVQPSKTILVGDSQSHVLSLWSGDPTGSTYQTSDPLRHGSKPNYLFADGHIEALAFVDACKAFAQLPY